MKMEKKDRMRYIYKKMPKKKKGCVCEIEW